MRCYSALKRNELWCHERTWKKLKCMLLNERTNMKRLQQCTITTMWHSGKGKTTETTESLKLSKCWEIQHGREVRGTEVPSSLKHSSVEAKGLWISRVWATEWQRHLQGPTGTTEWAIGAWLWTRRDKMGGISMEGRDPFLQRGKGKRKRGCESIGQYLDKRKTMDQG